MDRQIGPYFEIGIHGPPNWSELCNRDPWTAISLFWISPCISSSYYTIRFQTEPNYMHFWISQLGSGSVMLNLWANFRLGLWDNAIVRYSIQKIIYTSDKTNTGIHCLKWRNMLDMILNIIAVCRPLMSRKTCPNEKSYLKYFRNSTNNSWL